MRGAALVALVAVATALASCADGEPAPAIVIESAWARPTASAATPADAPPPAAPGVLYVTLRNDGRVADTVLAVRTDVAGEPELHVTTTTDGVARMEPVTGLALPPGGRVEMAPGGTHVMLFGLTRHLREGDRFGVAVELDSSGTVAAEAVVRVP